MDLKENEDAPRPENGVVAPPEEGPDAPDAIPEADEALPTQGSWFSFKGLLLWLALGGLIFATLCILERFKEAFLFGA